MTSCRRPSFQTYFSEVSTADDLFKYEALHADAEHSSATCLARSVSTCVLKTPSAASRQQSRDSIRRCKIAMPLALDCVAVAPGLVSSSGSGLAPFPFVAAARCDALAWPPVGPTASAFCWGVAAASARWLSTCPLGRAGIHCVLHWLSARPLGRAGLHSQPAGETSD